MIWEFLHLPPQGKNLTIWWLSSLISLTIIRTHFQGVTWPAQKIKNRLGRVQWSRASSETFSMNSWLILINAHQIMMMSLLKGLWEVIKVIKFLDFLLWNALDPYWYPKSQNSKSQYTVLWIKFTSSSLNWQPSSITKYSTVSLISWELSPMSLARNLAI